MFDLGFTKKDVIRTCWGAVIGAVVALAIALQTGETDWKILLGAVVGGAVAGIKNGVLADGSFLKG